MSEYGGLGRFLPPASLKALGSSIRIWAALARYGALADAFLSNTRREKQGFDSIRSDRGWLNCSCAFATGVSAEIN